MKGDAGEMQGRCEVACKGDRGMKGRCKEDAKEVLRRVSCE
jgi:hypothetical protein